MIVDISKELRELFYQEANNQPEYQIYINNDDITLSDIQDLFICGEWVMPSALDLLTDENIFYKKIENKLKSYGWKYWKSSCRILFKKEGFILKLAVDANSLMQNFAEVHFQNDIKLINQDKFKPKNLQIQTLLDWNNNYSLVLQEYIDGKNPNKNNQQVKKIMDYLYKWNVDDTERTNFVKKDNIYYLVDYGFADVEKYQVLN